MATRIAAARRDVDALLATLRGDSRSTPMRFAPVARRRQLTVAAVVRETPDAITLVFAPSPTLPTWRAGEFLTLGVRIDGVTHRRAYSIAVPPSAPAPAVTLKRVAGGLVSSWLLEHAAPGLVVDVQGPAGRFVLPRRDVHAPLVLIGGGSGITPLRAIAEHVLASEPTTRVTLVYGNRRAEDVIFAEQLAALTARSQSRLTILTVLSEPPPGWHGPVGLLDQPMLDTVLAPHVTGASYWICGPQPMMDAAHAVLSTRGVPPADVHSERFLALGAARADVAMPTTPLPLRVRVAGRTWTTDVRPGQSVLDAALQAGAPMPSSCTLGGCGACRVRLHGGEVAYETPNCLSDDERRDGHALACVARPLSALDIEVPT